MACSGTFFPSLISLLSTDGIVSSTQQVSVPSHLMVTPGSEHGCGVIYRKAKIYQWLHLREMAPHPHQRLIVNILLGRGGASWALPPLVVNCYLPNIGQITTLHQVHDGQVTSEDIFLLLIYAIFWLFHFFHSLQQRSLCLHWVMF